MISVILMMAGSGHRMGLQENKLFLPLGDKLLYQYALDLFLDLGFEVVCVIRDEDRARYQAYTSKVKFVEGGSTRQESVLAGLEQCEKEFVLIHDAARPFLAKEVIMQCVSALKKNHAFLVGTACKNSLYQKKPMVAVNRSEFLEAQTPQGGKTSIFLYCHLKAKEERKTATDDISLVLEYTNEVVDIIDGQDCNFKVTTQLDYILAKEWVKKNV